MVKFMISLHNFMINLYRFPHLYNVTANLQGLHINTFDLFFNESLYGTHTERVTATVAWKIMIHLYELLICITNSPKFTIMGINKMRLLSHYGHLYATLLKLNKTHIKINRVKSEL